MADGEAVDFRHVFRGEIDSINKRRPKDGQITLEDETLGDTPLIASDGTTPLRPTEKSNVIGLALSGGGVRSAAFCLGTLQGLENAKVLDRVDYLSTVSGGGYIGSSLSSGMTATGGHFPFKSYLSEDESPSLQHIRDYSNYLFPEGAVDVLRNVSVYARGLMANIVLVLPFLLLGAAVTIFSKPFASVKSGPNIAGIVKIPNYFGLDHFVISTYLALTLLAALILWGILKSAFAKRNVEVPGHAMKWTGYLILVLIGSAFCEFQPFILDAMFDLAQTSLMASFVAWIKSIILVLTPVAAAIAFVARKFGEVIKSSLESEKLRDQIPGYLAKLSVYVAGAIVPLLIWLAYLQFSYWGICLDEICRYERAPDWLSNLASHFPGDMTPSWLGQAPHKIAWLYIAVSAICLVIAMFLRPNANSLHPLYRDRLSKAFIFQPAKIVKRNKNGDQPPLAALPMKLSGLSEADSPYHLINTALNVQNSKTINRRGRNADFFLFSRNFVGSKATGYAPTAAMEAAMPTLDLATAMAASGAAASSNMGSASIKPLTATLALLNIRLGYWLRNPREVKTGSRWNRLANFYFLFEMFGLLNEKRRSVYITDGGHIENLGIYELLRRRCKVIIAVDAEADAQMAFGSFNVLERYALIDLGVRIDLPWQPIANATKEIGGQIDKTGDCEKRLGPHVAVGEISYPGNRKGILIYIKSSLTGDENDYVFHYKKRYGAFPHETTADQLFSEEQFEAYRALGFHAANRFFDRRDHFAHLDAKQNKCVGDQMDYLDKLFPVTSAPDPCWPRDHATFAAWVAADTKAAEEAATKKAADVALAATRLASAVETAAAAMAVKPSRADSPAG